MNNDKIPTKPDEISHLTIHGDLNIVTKPDEMSHLMIYGNLKIIDKESGVILVNKRI